MEGQRGEGVGLEKQRKWACGCLGQFLVIIPTVWGRHSVQEAPDFALPVSSQVHAYIISSLKKEMPNVFGKESKKKELVNNLGEIYQKIEREHQISPGDFPSLRKMQVELPWALGGRVVTWG